LLDEVGILEGNSRQAADFVRLITFRLAKNRQKSLARQFELGTGAVQSDFRVIFLSSSEIALSEMAKASGRSRLGGEEVRMIDIPACISDFEDIFDGWAAFEVGETLAEREKFVTELEAATAELQGTAFVEYLLRRAEDHWELDSINRYIDEFVVESPLSESKTSFARMRRYFAAVYGAAALAIDYKILPFNKKATLKDISKCMNDAIDLLVASKASAASPITQQISDEQLVADFKTRLASADYLLVGRRETPLTEQMIKNADVLFMRASGNKAKATKLLAHRFKEWYPHAPVRNRLGAILRERKVFGRGRQSDTLTTQVKLKQYPRRLACYSLFPGKLGLRFEDIPASQRH
jgi:hypothetical protein